jgi:hypothetical protein
MAVVHLTNLIAAFAAMEFLCRKNIDFSLNKAEGFCRNIILCGKKCF